MEREEGCGVDNGLDSRCGADNGLDRDVLTLLLMIEQPECKPTTTTAVVFAKQQSRTVLIVAVERRPASTITTWAMALGHQQGTTRNRPCRTSKTIQ